MQRFTLLHDGSDQGWQATYIALHVAARLGAPLLVLHITPDTNINIINEIATQVEISGRAAGVSVNTQFLADFSIDTLKEHIENADGLFAPLRLLPDEKTASSILNTFHCPIWISSTDSEIKEMAVLVRDPVRDVHLISFAKTFSHRLQQSIIALVSRDEKDEILENNLQGLAWKHLSNFTDEAIIKTAEDLNVGLLFISAINISIVENIPVNWVICPGREEIA